MKLQTIFAIAVVAFVYWQTSVIYKQNNTINQQSDTITTLRFEQKVSDTLVQKIIIVATLFDSLYFSMPEGEVSPKLNQISFNKLMLGSYNFRDSVGLYVNHYYKVLNK